ncbi:hypothetical protein D3C81_1861130 [compost metagenome]
MAGLLQRFRCRAGNVVVGVVQLAVGLHAADPVNHIRRRLDVAFALELPSGLDQGRLKSDLLGGLDEERFGFDLDHPSAL